jgi:hypothetical protein
MDSFSRRRSGCGGREYGEIRQKSRFDEQDDEFAQDQSATCANYSKTDCRRYVEEQPVSETGFPGSCFEFHAPQIDLECVSIGLDPFGIELEAPDFVLKVRNQIFGLRDRIIFHCAPRGIEDASDTNTVDNSRLSTFNCQPDSSSTSPIVNLPR